MRICGMLAIALVVSAPSWVTVVVAQNNPAAPSAPRPAIDLPHRLWRSRRTDCSSK